MKKMIVFVLVVTGMALPGYYFYSKNAETEANTARPTVEVMRDTIVDKVLAIGTIEPEHEISVKSKITGVVKKIYMEEGDYVKAGQALLEVKPDPTPLELTEANQRVSLRELAVGSIKRELDRQKALLDQEMVSASAYDEFRRQYEELSSRYKFDPADKDAVPMWDTTISDKFAANLFMAFNSFLGLIGSFTLAVAGLGVANIMFIVVQERTNEIGIKRAMGARRKDIMRAIFMETCYRTPRIGHRFRHRSRYHRSHAICADRRICRYAGTFTRGCRRNRRRSDDRQHMRRSHAGPPGS